jgi:hypothetical protein
MSVFSPTSNGFRTIFRQPAIAGAEIAWRWTLATAAWFLGGAFLLEYTSTLPVDAVDRFLLGTQQPALILRALQRIFHGSGLRFTQSGVLLAVAVAIAWIVLASLGRTATLQAIVQDMGVARPLSARAAIASLVGLNFLRAATVLAAIVALFGATFIASGVWSSTHLSVVDATRLWILFLSVVWIAWLIVNWILGTASVFVVSEGRPTFGAVATTVRWYRDRFWSVVAAGIWFGILHIASLIVAWLAGFAVLSFAGVLGPGPTLFILFLIVAIYCVIADSLHVARLAAYLWIANEDELQVRAPSEGPLDRSGDSAVDQTELILSDVPVPAM